MTRNEKRASRPAFFAIIESLHLMAVPVILAQARGAEAEQAGRSEHSRAVGGFPGEHQRKEAVADGYRDRAPVDQHEFAGDAFDEARQKRAMEWEADCGRRASQ